jgi:hypothetical protein
MRLGIHGPHYLETQGLKPQKLEFVTSALELQVSILVLGIDLCNHQAGPGRADIDGNWTQYRDIGIELVWLMFDESPTFRRRCSASHLGMGAWIYDS